MVTLAISVVGMLGLLMLKRWELTTGRVVGGSARPAVGDFAHRGLMWVESVLPGLARAWLYRAEESAHTFMHRAAALVVLLAERLLERSLHLLRRNTEARTDGQASAFLREVSAHKKELLQSARERAIYEE